MLNDNGFVSQNISGVRCFHDYMKRELDSESDYEDLLALEGLERHLAFVMASKGVVTLEDLAEQGIDELVEITELSEEKAGELIMAARNICWFGEDA